jgi:hypothetical protein
MTAIAVIVLEIEAIRKTGVRIERRARLDVGDAVPVKPRQRSIADHPDRQAGGRPAVQDLVDPGPHLVTSDRRDAHRAPPRIVDWLAPSTGFSRSTSRPTSAGVMGQRMYRPIGPTARPRYVLRAWITRMMSQMPATKKSHGSHVASTWGSDAIRLGHVCSS